MEATVTVVIFALAMLTIAFGGGFVCGWLLGFHAPVDERRAWDDLARDRARVKRTTWRQTQ